MMRQAAGRSQTGLKLRRETADGGIMQVQSAFATALLGVTRAERAIDAAASAVSAAFAPSHAADAAAHRLGPSDPLDAVAAGGDPVAPMVDLIAAQRAFTASLAALRADAEMQRSVLTMTR
jgi:hypothetical protein